MSKLKVRDKNNNWHEIALIEEVPEGLPQVTPADVGAILRVNAQGQWDKATIPNAEDNSFGGN